MNDYIKIKFNFIFLLFLITITQNIKGQSIIFNCDYVNPYYFTYDDAYLSAKLVFSPIDGVGWKVGIKIDSPKKYSLPDEIQEDKIQFPIEGIKIDNSEKKLALSNDKNQKIVLCIEKPLFSDSTINGYINLEEGCNYYIEDIELPYEASNITDGFHKLVKHILKPYAQITATCDNSIMGLINNPLGIAYDDSWRTPFSEFLPVAERFYGKYDSGLDYFREKEYNPFIQSYTQNYSIDICGQKVNAVNLYDAYLHFDLRRDRYDDTKYIKSTKYDIYLKTPKAFKKSPQFNIKEDCIWNKELALNYCNKIKQELDLLGCNMQKIKSKSICKYEGMKNGKVITLDLRKINDEFFAASLNIAHKTKDYDFYIIWD